ncbi:hypothetical protein B4098_0150 [Heyndrickxia coagulans]|uniref:Uncharacterized protein n=1 Tax=Heyndrickxia coagulans TaxID=1398 RepID=A0A150JRG2_HEYCO|nr:hypothetical protein B4098_0150 [Heyndrickxia coagulans]
MRDKSCPGGPGNERHPDFYPAGPLWHGRYFLNPALIRPV